MNAKYTFWYVLSLVSLIIGSIAIGAVVWQLINKGIVEGVGSLYASLYSLETLRFGLASLLIAAPVYLWSVRSINKGLESDELAGNAGVRRWLTYFIMLVSAVVLVGYGIGIIYTFLQGELTLKFILKALTVAALSTSILSYYSYDLKHTERRGPVIKVLKKWRFGVIAIIVAVLVSGFLMAESPAVTKAKRQDSEVVNQMVGIVSAINTYYERTEQLPIELQDIVGELGYIEQSDLVNLVSGESFSYNKLEADKYEICANFQVESDINDVYRPIVGGQTFEHKAGEKCFERIVGPGSESKLQYYQ